MKLLDAILADDADAVRKARRRRRDVNKPLSGGYTPIEVAARRGKVNAIRVLLDAGADPHERALTRKHSHDVIRLEGSAWSSVLPVTVARRSPSKASPSPKASARSTTAPAPKVANPSSSKSSAFAGKSPSRRT